MNIYIGVTDKDWYNQLRKEKPDEVNFWNPGVSPFRALKENELFLFKLHSPNNYIVGGGFFVRYSLLPPFLAWSAFGRKNGTESYDELMKRIIKYRSKLDYSSNPQIGCTILTEPFWFSEDEWLKVPEWSPNIVRGKKYDTETEVGQRLYLDIQERLKSGNRQIAAPASAERYGISTVRHRLGQGGFRVAVTDAYQRRCAITGEKTLPVLEAAHIIPYSQDGQHTVNNGILLKSDFHTLFDDGYITLTQDYIVEVSKTLHEDYGNGKDYYKYHGQKLLILPDNETLRPDSNYIEWHNNNVYRG